MTSSTDIQIVDHEVLAQVKRLAAARARVNLQELPQVAWTLLRNMARKAKPVEDGVAHPANRPAAAEKERIRFRAPREEYAQVRAAIRASGRSISSALEDALEEYGRSGKLD